MTISPDQAADALRGVADAARRSTRAYAYLHASPNLIVWGVLWAVGYGLTDVWPQRVGAIWIAIVAIGLASSFVVGFRSGGSRRKTMSADPTQPRSASETRILPAIILIAFAFVAATLAVMAPVSARQVGAFIPLVVAAAYAVAGIWLGLRFVTAGIAVAALTLVGFFLLPAHFPLWMAGVGGGALILAGLWFRRA